jgi:DNA-binding NtrC family response regulator
LQQIYDRYGLKHYTISDESIAIMLDYEWPGNVRQLENAMQFAVIKCKSNEIMPHDLPMELAEFKNDGIKRGPSKKLDIEIVKTALGKAGGNKAKAARLLGVGRATLYRFLDDNADIDPGTF